MPTKLLVAVDSASVGAPAKNALTAFFQGKGWQVWHWFDDLWLIADLSEEIEVKGLVSEIKTLPGFADPAQFIVITIDGEAPYYGWARPKAWEWMKTNWGPLK